MGYVPKPESDKARQPTAGVMTIIKSEFYRLSSQVSRLWGHRQESMAGSGRGVSGLCRGDCKYVLRTKTGAAKSRTLPELKQRLRDRQTDRHSGCRAEEENRNLTVKREKGCKILDTNRTDTQR